MADSDADQDQQDQQPAETPASTPPAEPVDPGDATPTDDKPALLVPPEQQRRAAGGSGGSVSSGPASHVPSSLRHVDWTEAFPFVGLFHGFRVAIHPSKLLLCLVAVVLIYGGARALDGLANVMPGDTWQALEDEPFLYERFVDEGNGTDFAAVRKLGREANEEELDTLRLAAAEGDLDRRESITKGDLIDAVAERRDAALASLEPRDGDSETFEASAETRIAAANRAAADEVNRIEALHGVGPGIAFYAYEAAQIAAVADATLALDVAGANGMVAALYRLLWVGPGWLFGQHTLYGVLLFAWSLVVLSIFGGAVARSAAVQVARDEKISLRSALRFSTGKFVSFLSAPLIPVLVIAVVGGAVALVALVLSLIGLIPGLSWVADIGIGLLFPLAALAGIVMALTFIGLVGGLSLMYPTIAAEGTDSFDAISRSFSYLFARPWRLAFYALVAVAYGAVCFLVARAFTWLVLMMARSSVGIFLTGDRRGLLDAIWPAQGPSRFSYDIPFVNLNWSESIAAVLVAFTVYLALSLLASFALSLYLSLGTIVYFLMRRQVDETELEDVYLDPADEEYAGYADVPEDPLAEPEPTPTTPPSTEPAT